MNERTNQCTKSKWKQRRKNGSKESESEQHQHEQARKLQQAASSNDNKIEWTNGGGPANDGMSSYKAKTGVI
jgi:hypothetical protein